MAWARTSFRSHAKTQRSPMLSPAAKEAIEPGEHHKNYRDADQLRPAHASTSVEAIEIIAKIQRPEPIRPSFAVRLLPIEGENSTIRLRLSEDFFGAQEHIQRVKRPHIRLSRCQSIVCGRVPKFCLGTLHAL